MKQILLLSVLLFITLSCESPTNSVVNSGTKTVEVTAPKILAQPVSQSVAEGSGVTFSVVASGDSLKYQWKRNDVIITDATGPVYTIDAVTSEDDELRVTVLVFNAKGSVESDTASLTVLTGDVPKITSHPEDVYVVLDHSASFSVSARGEGIEYQWRRDSVNIDGATSATLLLPVATMADHGAEYDCIVSNRSGADTSESAVLTVIVTDTINTAVIGVVVTPEGVPAAAARVELFDRNASSDTALVSAITDSNGQYQIENPEPKTYSLLVTYDDFAYFDDSLAVDSGVTVMRTDTVGETGSIVIPLEIQKNHDPRQFTAQILGTSYTAQANGNSHITFRNIPTGNFNLRISTSLENYPDFLTSFTLTPDTPDTLNQTIELPYTGIPIVSGITASYDSLTGIATIQWEKSEYGSIDGFLIYRYSGTEIPSEPIAFVSSETNTFQDNLAGESQPEGTHYRVVIRSVTGEIGPGFESVSVHHI